MPIKVQSDLPAREILERENIFVMDENRAVASGYPSDPHRNFESDATEGGHGAAAAAFSLQYAASGRRHICKSELA